MVRIEVTNGQAPFVHQYKEDYTVAYRHQQIVYKERTDTHN